MLAASDHVTGRQLQRDWRRWLAVSPLHLARIARVQRVARLSSGELSLASIAADAGYADQAHMNREIKQFTGLTPRAWVATRSHTLAHAFRGLVGNGVVYL